MKFPRFHTISAAALGVLTAAAIAIPITGGAAAARAATTTASSPCTASVNGPAVPMKVATPGKAATCTFSGKAGQRISTVVTNLVINNGSCATLTLLNPSGGVVDTSGQDCGLSSIGLANAPDVLTVSGTYTVRLELDQTATGSAKLWVSAPVTVGTVTVNGPAVSMNVTRVGQGGATHLPAARPASGSAQWSPTWSSTTVTAAAAARTLTVAEPQRRRWSIPAGKTAASPASAWQTPRTC